MKVEMQIEMHLPVACFSNHITISGLARLPPCVIDDLE